MNPSDLQSQWPNKHSIKLCYGGGDHPKKPKNEHLTPDFTQEIGFFGFFVS